jgi:hypothetical protein
MRSQWRGRMRRPLRMYEESVKEVWVEDEK